MFMSPEMILGKAEKDGWTMRTTDVTWVMQCYASIFQQLHYLGLQKLHMNPGCRCPIYESWKTSTCLNPGNTWL